MPVESAADRLSFLDADEFGEEATYTLAGGGATPGIPGILNDPHLSVLAGDGVEVCDSQPTLLCRSADLPGAAAGGDAGDTLAVAATAVHGAVTYRVAELRPDGQGFTLIVLAASS
jgi:hypothetical protein